MKTHQEIEEEFDKYIDDRQEEFDFTSQAFIAKELKSFFHTNRQEILDEVIKEQEEKLSIAREEYRVFGTQYLEGEILARNNIIASLEAKRKLI